jgi:serine/threonine protein kinase
MVQNGPKIPWGIMGRGGRRWRKHGAAEPSTEDQRRFSELRCSYTSARLESAEPLFRRGRGTLTYTPPETLPKPAEGAEFLTARDYQPGDMWALGIVLANVLGGSGIRLSHLGSHDKKIFAQAEDRVIWTKLNKLPAALQEQTVPSEWKDVMDLLRSLTREDPVERMTAKEVLDHPFLKLADKIQGLYA